MARFCKHIPTAVAAVGLLLACLGAPVQPALAAAPALAAPVSFIQCRTDEPGNHGLQTDTAGCSLGAGGALSAFGNVALGPFVLLSGQATAYGFPANAVGASVTAHLEFEFQVTGGTPGAMVPILIATNMDTVGHDDSKAWAIATLNVGNGLGQGVGIAACSPDLNCDGGFGGGASFHGVVPLQMRSGGPNGSVFMSITAVAGASFVDEFASVSADPFFFVDPGFPDAGLYTITLSPGVANAPVPEPGSAVLLLCGLAALARRRGRPC